MAIDMATLKATSYGDPDSKLTVKRSWLKEVHKLLEEAEQTKRELAALKASKTDVEKEFSKMDKIFGKDSAFDHFFPGRKK